MNNLLDSKHKEAFLTSIDNLLDYESAFKADNIIVKDIYWVDSNNVKQHNIGYRVQWNNLNGPYKGGLRFHPSVDVELFKKLAFEQTLKNILTTLPMGGAKGGSDFDPHNKSKEDIKLFCNAYMDNFYMYFGVDKDIPAGDIGVGSFEVECLYNRYVSITGKHDCALTGKPISLGGSLCRKEATGYGLCYITNRMLNVICNDSFKNKRVIISGSGNVAIYAAEKVIELGAKVIAMSDSSNAIYDEDGINLDIIKQIKEVKKDRIKEYISFKKSAKVMQSKDIWSVKGDIYLPCATQNEIDVEEAKKIINNKAICVCEGSNMSATSEATKLLLENNILYIPGKASNAGGVTVSGLEIEQNVKGVKYSFSEVDNRLKEIMENIFNNINDVCIKMNKPNNFMFGANYYSFSKLIELFENK